MIRFALALGVMIGAIGSVLSAAIADDFGYEPWGGPLVFAFLSAAMLAGVALGGAGRDDR